jgi:TolB protein
MAPRVLAPGQRSQVWLAATTTDAATLVLETTDLLVEAPNWTLDGRLLLNGDGVLWTLDPDAEKGAAGLQRVDLPGIPDLNNDHVLDPDGEHVWVSAMDTHIYKSPLAGGPSERVTPEDGRWHFLHGVSPDGKRLAYVEISDLAHPVGQLVVLEPHGSTQRVETGPAHIDGPEWSPDGAWIYFNSEAWATQPGHAQLARVPDRGGPVERLVTSGTVDWFPHLSPDGAWATYICFPPGTQGHPADLDVEVRLVSTDDWSTPVHRYPLLGGQGTLNVNSWSPDSTRFAFVAYPVA